MSSFIFNTINRVQEQQAFGEPATHFYFPVLTARVRPQIAIFFSLAYNHSYIT